MLSQASFYSAPGRVLHFGLGKVTTADVVIAGKPVKGLAVNKRYSWSADGVIREVKTGNR